MLKIDIKLPRRDFCLQIKTIFDNGISGIIGQSGAGKSSLLHIIAGLEKNATGRVELNNQLLSDSATNHFITAHQRQVGIVFQDLRLFPHMNIEKNLRYGQRNQRQNKNGIDFAEIVQLLKLAHLLRCRPQNLSGGERQRVAIGRTLLAAPRLLLLDEPFSAVDTKHRSEILHHLRAIHEQTKIPIIIVSHNLPEIFHLTKNILTLEKGRIIKNMKSQELQHTNFYFSTQKLMLA